MGEIRAKVKLINAVDEALWRRGQLAEDKIRTYQAEALVDTGAVRSVIPVHVQEKLGLGLRGHRKDSVGITEALIIEIQGRDTLEEALVLGDEVLIGQTVLEKLDLLADCSRGQVIANPAHPDQPVSKVKALCSRRELWG